MKETSVDPPDIDSNRPRAKSKAHGSSLRSSPPPPHLSESTSWTANREHTKQGGATTAPSPDNANASLLHAVPSPVDSKAAHPEFGSISVIPAAPALHDEGQRSVVDAARADLDSPSNHDNEKPSPKPKRGFIGEVRRTFRMVITYSWLNVLLVFVPIGIAVANIHGIHGGIVFAMNCIAVIPLAGLLSFATESVACNMGDALGALLNVTFGNAVELIIFIIALVKNQIRIVQASLLGSILANLLLILGMGFFLGGLRYREQIYNSTVTQMSACLLSLSVISLVLPTAFHASFKDSAKADEQSLKISRGTSVILLLVYFIYLLFQLKSHAYMYESTPQHIVDAESTPGPAAAWLDSSSSDDSSSSSSESDSSGHSRDTVRRKMKKVLRAGRRRKSSDSSTDTLDTNAIRAGSSAAVNSGPMDEPISETSPRLSKLHHVSSPDSNDEDMEEAKSKRRRIKQRIHRHRRRHRRHRRADDDGSLKPAIRQPAESGREGQEGGQPRRVDFAVPHEQVVSGTAAGEGANPSSPPRRPFPTLRGMSVRNLAPSVFIQSSESPAPAGPVPRVRYGIRRTNSLPDRLHRHHPVRPPGAMLPSQIPARSLTGGTASTGGAEAGEEGEEERLSRTASVVLLLLTTGLVAVCAEFLVSSIESVTKTSSIGEIFIGLIILPIVGNAAEHVTAITVAMKNKMDLAIGVAVGSSIQIAIFVTPLVVILGWIIGREMTLYFTLFETVSLFVSAFIVNFLVLDGRSNYLEGALLCAVYVIIGIVAFFYPDGQEASAFGG